LTSSRRAGFVDNPDAVTRQQHPLAFLNALFQHAAAYTHVAPQRRRTAAITPPTNRANAVQHLVRTHPVVVVGILIVASFAGLLLLPPISQDQNYHQFADQRTLLGVPNFWNVVSNLPFIAVGAAGLQRFRPASAHPATTGSPTTARCFGTGCQ
jgi:hypothetical protein